MKNINNITTEIQGVERSVKSALAKNSQLKILAMDESFDTIPSKRNLEESFDSIKHDLENTLSALETINKMLRDN